MIYDRMNSKGPRTTVGFLQFQDDVKHDFYPRFFHPLNAKIKYWNDKFRTDEGKLLNYCGSGRKTLGQHLV